MPQMAPMNWLILFIYFMIIFMFLSSIIYFNFFKIKNLKNNYMKKEITYYNKLI